MSEASAMEMQPVDISGFSQRAYDIMTLSTLGTSAADEIEIIYKDISKLAKETFAKRPCIVDAEYRVGYGVEGDSPPEPIGAYDAPFLGLYTSATAVILPQEQAEIVPSLVFKPFDPEELPYYLEQRCNTVASLYPKVAIPLVGVPMSIYITYLAASE
jgi:hypothetical protein